MTSHSDRTPIEVILLAGARATGATIRELRCRRRHRWFVKRRAFVARKMRAEGYSLKQIGRALGGRHHTTILHYLTS